MVNNYFLIVIRQDKRGCKENKKTKFRQHSQFYRIRRINMNIVGPRLEMFEIMKQQKINFVLNRITD